MWAGDSNGEKAKFCLGVRYLGAEDTELEPR